jgi:ATP-dependent RNA helicase RhlE
VLAELLRLDGVGRALVFTRTKHGADKVVKNLAADGITANAIHGNKGQSQRERALAEFRAGTAPVLVATDIAARGIDVDGVTHVIQHDMPDTPEAYVHRIGRTARAGAEGSAIAFCTPEERPLLRDIEKTIRAQVPVTEHALGLKGVQQLAPSFGWNPMGKDKGKPKKPHHRGQNPNRNHGAGQEQKQGKPQGQRPAAGQHAPKRAGGGSWMSEIGKRQA